MTGYERDQIEVGARVTISLEAENELGEDLRHKVIRKRAMRALVKDNRRRPGKTRPKTLSVLGMLGGLGILLTGCVLPPPLTDLATDSPPPANDVRIDSPILVVALPNCRTPEGFPFHYEGSADNAPWASCGVPPLLQKGAK